MWVKAQHILVASEPACLELQRQLEAGASFAQLALEYSECPTGAQGGLLGQFSPGHMPPEIDEVVFQDEIGPVHGPVQSAWGFHLIQVLERSDT